MLVLQPKISTATDSAGVLVSVMVAVWVGVTVLVNVSVTEMTAPFVAVNTSGVAVITDGVREGNGVQAGNGCGVIPKVMQELRKKVNIGRREIFFME